MVGIEAEAAVGLIARIQSLPRQHGPAKFNLSGDKKNKKVILPIF
jgi:hypothetical protein